MHTNNHGAQSDQGAKQRRRAAPLTQERFQTGVSLDREVVRYVDELAERMGLGRSHVLNAIVYEYAKLIEKRSLRPLVDLASVRF